MLIGYGDSGVSRDENKGQVKMVVGEEGWRIELQTAPVLSPVYWSNVHLNRIGR